MSVDVTARNIAADAVTAVAARMALHTGDPGAAAANEVVGGGYGRQDVTWDAAAGGLAAIAASIVFPCPPVDVLWATFWSADGLTRYGKAAVSPVASFPVAGFLTITGGDLDFSA